MTKPVLAYIGLGAMGGRICANMTRKHDGEMHVFDQNTTSVDAAVAAGAKAAASLKDIAELADIIFLCLPGGKEVEAVILGEDGLLQHGRAGQTIVDMSTCPVGIARKAASALAEAGINLADAPVARTLAAAETGSLSIMVGGEESIYQRILPYLQFAGSDITHCGGVGTGQAVKIINNMLLIQQVVAVAQAFTMGERAGLDPKLLAETLSMGSGDSFALRNHGMKAMLADNFPINQFGTDYAIKDISYALDLAADMNVSVPAAELAREMLSRTSEAGHGAEYFPVLYKMIKDA